MDWQAAALACCPIGTSLRALKTVAGINPGDTVLITGASGGLGVHQIQIARALGGHVIAVTTSAAKANMLNSLGAADVVVAKDLSYSADVWRLSGKRGVDIAIDNLGATLTETLRCMTQGGIVVVLGNIEGNAAPVSPGLLIGRRLRHRRLGHGHAGGCTAIAGDDSGRHGQAGDLSVGGNSPRRRRPTPCSRPAPSRGAW